MKLSSKVRCWRATNEPQSVSRLLACRTQLKQQGGEKNPSQKTNPQNCVQCEPQVLGTNLLNPYVCSCWSALTSQLWLRKPALSLISQGFLNCLMWKRETTFQRHYSIASGILCYHILNDYFLKYGILSAIWIWFESTFRLEIFIAGKCIPAVIHCIYWRC